MSPTSLLPSNATPWMKAVEQASAERRPLDTDAIRRVWDPWTCPEDQLFACAHAFGVKLWEESWPVSRKRSIIANNIELRRLEGTLEGLERYLSYVDAEVIRVYRPPAKVFSGPTLTRAEREAWLSELPQIRIWRIKETAPAGNRMFAGGPGYKSFFEGKFTYPNGAPDRLRRRARWLVDGVEQDAIVESLGGFFRVNLRGVRPRSVFCGMPFARRFFLPSTAAERMVTIAPASVKPPWRSPVGPQLEPVSAEPEHIIVPGQEGHAVYSNRPFYRRFYLPSNAAFRTYERYAVQDGRLVHKRPSIQFMGVGRYGIPAHTAEIKIRVRGQRSRFAAGEGVSVPGGRFWLPHDPGVMQRVRRAVLASKRLTDKILIDTNTQSGFIAGQPFFAGVDELVV